MPTVQEFPRPVREIENVFIELADGCRLAARIWLPADAEADPVPAILEYLPYRKRDGTSQRDALTHPYFAGHGYACVRVDMRGNGEFDGLMLDEYTEQEQDDALEVIDWIARQPWCTGAVGMIGISWGGFNGLQVAARRPPALKAVITLCSTDDRYADDIHFMGGCLLNDNLSWASTMFAYSSRPPDPALVGERWRELWLHRLENTVLLVEEWLRHQRRDRQWRHGSVCEDFDAIQCPVYAVGGWADGYSNAIPRLLAGLQRAEEGPDRPLGAPIPALRHARPPDRLSPGVPALVGPLAEGHRTGIMAEPMYRVWLQESVPPRASLRRAPGPLGGRAVLALAEHRDARVRPGARRGSPRLSPSGLTRGSMADSSRPSRTVSRGRDRHQDAAVPRHRRGLVVRLRRQRRCPLRPARRRRHGGLLRDRAARRAPGDPRRPGAHARGRCRTGRTRCCARACATSRRAARRCA